MRLGCGRGLGGQATRGAGPAQMRETGRRRRAVVITHRLWCIRALRLGHGRDGWQALACRVMVVVILALVVLGGLMQPPGEGLNLLCPLDALLVEHVLQHLATRSQRLRVHLQAVELLLQCGLGSLMLLPLCLQLLLELTDPCSPPLPEGPLSSPVLGLALCWRCVSSWLPAGLWPRRDDPFLGGH